MLGPSSLKNTTVFLRLNRLDYVPSGLYSAEILAENHFPTLAIEYGFFQTTLQFEPGKVSRLRLGHPWARKLPSFLRSPFLHLTAAARLFGLIIRRGRPALLVAEGLHEQAIAWGLSRLLRFPYAVHVHEVFDGPELRGWSKVPFWLEGPALRAAQFTIFPEIERSEIYRLRYRLAVPIHIAFNCPRKLVPTTATCWRTRLNLPSDSFLLGYWGGQGKTNALEQAIRAVARNPKIYFLLWGWSSAEDRRYFEKLAAGVGAGHRILFLGELPKAKWAALAGLDLSYCVYEPKELRLAHLATASNKVMESLSVGVPVLTSPETDFRSLVEQNDIGICSDSYTVDDISRAMRQMVESPEVRLRQSGNALRLHHNFFHYEYQFKKVLRKLLGEFASAAQQRIEQSPAA